MTIIEKPKALYPGAPVLLTRFVRAGEYGDVRVQDFTDTNTPEAVFKVGTFLPGVVEESPGDTPKVWPEVHQYCATFEQALDVFGRYVETAKSAGWEEADACE